MIPVPYRNSHRTGSRHLRFAGVCAAMALAIMLFVLLTIPDAAQAAEPSLTRYDQNDGHLVYTGTWDVFGKTAAYGGGYARSSTSAGSVTIYFDGTRLDWIAMKGSTTGLADVYLDGSFVETVNLAAPSARYQVNVWSTGDLPAGQHYVKIVRSPGTPAGKFATIDAVDVAGSLIYAPPAVTGVNPVSGSTDGGASVIITGSSFNDATAVTFGGVDAVSFAVDSAKRITALAPPHAAGTVDVQVTTPSGPSPDTAADDYLYAEVTVPAVGGLSPATGTSGTKVVITGSGFIGLTGPGAVTFGGVSAASYVVDSPNQITAVAPSLPGSQVQVKVTALGGTSIDTPADDFTFLTRYDQTDSRISYSGAWAAYSTTSAWKSSYGRTSSTGGSVTLTFFGTRLTWIATMGRTTGLADVYVDGVFQTRVDLSAPAVGYQKDVWSTGDLSEKVHTVKIVRSAASPSGKYLTFDAVDIVGTLLGGGRAEQTDSRLGYSSGWGVVSASGASGGSYRRASASGAAVYVEFTGTDLAWIATKGSSMGKAWVSVDGGVAKSVDLAAGSTMYRQKVWETGHLALGDHEVKIWRDGSNPPGKYIAVDAFDVVGSLKKTYAWFSYQETDFRMLYTGSWSTVSDSNASGGGYRRTNSTSAYLDFMFSGRQLEWFATVGPAMGKAAISIDGGPLVIVDLYSDSPLHQQKVWASPVLSDGYHRVQIEVAATSASGAYITADAFNVRGSLPGVSSTAVAKTLWAEQRLRELSYLPGAINGTFDTKTRGAVIAFQKWEGLTRDGAIGATVWARLHTAARPQPSRTGTTDPWIEVNKTKQVLLFCRNGKVVYTIPVSTGSASVGFATPSGTFSIISKTPPRDHLYYPMAITSGIAIHGYPTVPTYPASHGCVRTQNWDQDVLYPITPKGTRVYIY